jgi:hypothetical protein
MRPAVVCATLLLVAASAAPAWGGTRPAVDPQPSKAAVPGPTAPPKLPVVAKARFNPADAKNGWGFDRTGAAVMINGFKADGQGFGVLYWTLRNESVEGLGLGPGNFTSERWGTDIVAPSGVNIVDGGRRHATLVHSKGCLCYRNPPGIDFSSVDKGEEILLTQVFAVSPAATKITVEIPGFHPVPNIPVQR